MRILIIDDEVRFRQMLRTFLVKLGHDVHDIDGGPETFQLLRAFQYDVVTLDLSMPQVNGLTKLSDIRRDAPETHIIVISAEANIRIAVESIKGGATACFDKPVNFVALENELTRLARLSSDTARESVLSLGLSYSGRERESA
jgi:DNA-binding NtrC family response regulator